MKSLAVMSSLGSVTNKVGFKIKKRSPEILVVSGIVGVVVSTVMACKATTKVSEILDDSKQQLDSINAVSSDPDAEKKYDYTSEDANKDAFIVRVQTGIKLAKLYAPAVTLGLLSVTAILTSNNILRKRNAALAAAYTAVLTDFKGYRARVIEKFGEELDHQLRYNTKEIEVSETVTDEKGKEKNVKKKVEVVDPAAASPYLKYFTKSNMYWDDSELHLESFFRAKQYHFNDLLRAKKVLTLNTVLGELGFDDTSKMGMVVGWIYDPYGKSAEVGDNYVQLDIKKVRIPTEDGVTYEDAYAIDFNVDGEIYSRL